MQDSTNEPESTLTKIFGWGIIAIIILVLVSVPLFFLIHASKTLLATLETRNWSQVQGEITHSEAVHERLAGSDTDYWWKLEYEYEVDGEKYRGNRHSINRKTGRTHRFSIKSSTYDLAEDQFHAGDTVTVYYDAAKPSTSVISQEFSGLTIIELLAGILLCGAIIAILLKSFRKKE